MRADVEQASAAEACGARQALELGALRGRGRELDQLILATERRLKREGVVHRRQSMQVDFAGQGFVSFGKGKVGVGSLLESCCRSRFQPRANKTGHETREISFEKTPHAFE